MPMGLQEDCFAKWERNMIKRFENEAIQFKPITIKNPALAGFLVGCKK